MADQAVPARWRTEIAAGAVTFVTMAYILTVHPAVLRTAGMPADAVFTATALATALATLLMAIYGRLPFAVAPGMGLNVFFAHHLVVAQGYTWQQALAIVLLSGLGFLLLAALRVREALLRGVPASLVRALGAGLGLMLAVIGLEQAGWLVRGEPLVALGDYAAPGPLAAMAGLVVMGWLWARRVRGSVLIGIAFATLLGLPLGLTAWEELARTGPALWPPSPAPVCFAFDFSPLTDGDPRRALSFVAACLTLLLIDLFDGMGTLLGVLLPRDGDGGAGVAVDDGAVRRALLCDAGGTVIGACLGMSTMTAYVESAAGVAAGGRTGKTAAAVAGLFILALFFRPLFALPPAAAVAPALILVGLFLLEPIRRIDFADATEGLPALLLLVVTGLTWSVTDGLMVGVLGHVALKLGAGRRRDLGGATWLLAGVFLLKALAERL